MFPLLPAILLLLLNGSTGLDKAAHQACLPEAIKALHRQISESRDGEINLKGLENELILASLLAAGSDKELSQAISDLLLMAGIDEPAPKPPPPDDDPPLVRFIKPENLRLQSGFCNSARSRDGPATR